VIWRRSRANVQGSVSHQGSVVLIAHACPEHVSMHARRPCRYIRVCATCVSLSVQLYSFLCAPRPKNLRFKNPQSKNHLTCRYRRALRAAYCTGGRAAAALPHARAIRAAPARAPAATAALCVSHGPAARKVRVHVCALIYLRAHATLTA